VIAFNLNERADARLMPVVYRAPQRPRQLPRTVIAEFATCIRIQNRQYSPNITRLNADSPFLQIPLELFGGPVCVRFDHTYS